ncbi:hypothetical protein GCM10014713_55460 [Streptomyces purpureus]|uniref:Uncharacterized protein n=1 Tax=Streptomyces purpureus TaxID=1951 RepID=A0A918HCL6_9ACTN|nr:hypothetical protein GCM10014713_55460 [Streptomyces purpureus]
MTGVTARVSERCPLTPSLHEPHLICAIARLWGGLLAGTKKIALDPAESSAIDDEDLLGQATVDGAIGRAVGLGDPLRPV